MKKPKLKKQAISAKPTVPAVPIPAAPTRDFHQAVHGIFEKIQVKTGLSNDKIDQFQKSWLALPQTRTKYQHLTDAPLVAIEEGIAMANDIVDYLQNEEGGKSLALQALKAEAHKLAEHPVDYLKGKFEKAEGMAKGFLAKIQAEAKSFQKTPLPKDKK